ncbi:hypothetical protein RBB50_006892 [Rhinocladiella similis]
MVIVDTERNGYRAVIIPLAVTDALVQTAVSSTAASHLGQRDPKLRNEADSERIKVIQMLKSAASFRECSQEVFSVSTWATLLVLLVGEMITGRDDYRYLVRMIGLIRTKGVNDVGPETRAFLETQTDTLTLLAQPFLDTSGCLSMVSSENHLFQQTDISPQSLPDPCDRRTANSILKAYQLCHRIYLNRRMLSTCGCGRKDTLALEQLRRLVNPIRPDLRGGHSLVWVYFIAAAESGYDDDDGGVAGAGEGNRAFFTRRLEDIYTATGARNIPLGIAMLDQLSHARHVTGWPDALSRIASSFVM